VGKEKVNINDAIAAWLRSFESSGLNDRDTLRALAYARDLERGLSTIRTFSQGVTVFGSARLKPDNQYYKLSVELGGKLARAGHPVITGGGPGIMEAANKGAFEAGGRSVGLNIQLEHEQHPNPYLTDMFEFRYFFARKVMLAFSAKVFVFMPGGFGTLDEVAEVLVLVQEGKMPKTPMFFVGSNFWNPLDKFFEMRLEEMGLIGKNDRKQLYTITDNIDDIVDVANEIGDVLINDELYDKFSEDV